MIFILVTTRTELRGKGRRVKLNLENMYCSLGKTDCRKEKAEELVFKKLALFFVLDCRVAEDFLFFFVFFTANSHIVQKNQAI